jgi:hypothetical protein
MDDSMMKLDRATRKLNDSKNNISEDMINSKITRKNSEDKMR